MRLGMAGLGKMGLGMARRLLRAGHSVAAFNRSPERLALAAAAGAEAADGLADLARRLAPPRVVWLMMPAGGPVRDSVSALLPALGRGDVVVDGGNSFYGDAAAHASALARVGAHFLDVGVSGGIAGERDGYCLMAGGEPDAYEAVLPALQDLAGPRGCALVGPGGAGHYAKMVHNGIEYGLMQAYAEGFELLYAAPFPFDLGALAGLWNGGSVVRSWLLQLAEQALRRDPELGSVKGWVEDSGEGRWALKEAVDLAVPMPALTAALFRRFRSRQEGPFGDRLLSALRLGFGGHKAAPP